MSKRIAIAKRLITSSDVRAQNVCADNAVGVRVDDRLEHPHRLVYSPVRVPLGRVAARMRTFIPFSRAAFSVSPTDASAGIVKTTLGVPRKSGRVLLPSSRFDRDHLTLVPGHWRQRE